MDSGIVKCRKEGTWIYYSLDKELCADVLNFLRNVLEE